MDDRERHNLAALLITHRSNLRQLEDQAATYSTTVPVHIQNDIDYEQGEIARITALLETGNAATNDSDGERSDMSTPQLVVREVLRIDGDYVGGDHIAGDKTTISDVSTSAITIGSTLTNSTIAINSTIYAAADRYDVRGFPSPYLGLKAFTYEERSLFAGREHIVEVALTKLTTPGAQPSLMFITGTSGSGKSSLAQAGLVPALEKYYQQLQLDVRHAVMRPGRQPLAGLANALLQLGRPIDKHFAAVKPFLVGVPTKALQDASIELLLIDQFEELFSAQCDPAQRDAFFAVLAALPSFTSVRMQILATMRADFLPDLFAYPALYDVAKQGIDLRAMTVDELHDAIQRPIQQSYPEKSFEPALVQVLAMDAAEDAAYLPLLQVTLEDIWRGGRLTRDAYGSLTDAIRRRADNVLAYADYDGTHTTPRTHEEQEEILSIFLDLIAVSLDDDVRRDVRRRRATRDVDRGDPRRGRLIVDLATARLVSTGAEHQGTEEIEVVDLIHETLIANWDRLHDAVVKQRAALQRRARFEHALGEWLAADRDDAYLLDGVRLAEAEALAEARDVALYSEVAQELLRRSATARQAERARELAQVQSLADARARIVTRTRRFSIGLSIMALLALIAAGAAWKFGRQAQNSAEQAQQNAVQADHNAATAIAEGQRASVQTQLAQQQARVARSGELAAQAELTREAYPQRSLLLALESMHSMHPDDPLVTRNEQALRDGLATISGIALTGHEGTVGALALSADDRILVTGSDDHTVRIWDITALDPNKSVRILRGHTGNVRQVALSADNRTLVTGSDDHTVRIWDLSIPDPNASVRILSGHTDSVITLALSTDGRTLATGSMDGTVRIWDMTASDPNTNVRILRGPDAPFAQGPSIIAGELVLSADGHTLATGGLDGIVRVWDITAPDPNANVRILRGHDVHLAKTIVWSMLLSVDGRTLVTGGDDSTVRIWDLSIPDPNTSVRILSGHTDSVMTLALSTDGRTLATGSMDGTARIWNLTAPNPETSVRVLLGHTGGVMTLALSTNAYTLVTGSIDGTVRIWNLAVSEPSQNVRVLYGHEGAVVALSLSADDRTIVTGSMDGTARVWNLTAPNLSTRVLQRSETGGDVLALSADGHTLVTDDIFGSLSVWNLGTPDPNGSVRILSGHKERLREVVLSANGQTLVTGSDDQTIRVWDLTAPDPNTTARVLPRLSDSLALSADGHLLVTEADDDTIQVLDLRVLNPNQSVRVLLRHKNRVRALALSANGRTLVMEDTDATILVWDLSAPDPNQTVRILRGEANEAGRLMLSADGRTLLTGGTKNVILVWDLTDPNRNQPIRTLQVEANVGRKLALSDDGHTLVADGLNATVLVWDLTAPDPNVNIRTLRGHESGVEALVLSGDGHTLVTGSRDNTVRVWNLTVPDPNTSVLILRGHTIFVDALGLSTDTRTLVTKDLLGSTWVWTLAPDALLEPACRVAGRNLSLAEWQQYFNGQPYHRTCSTLPDGLGITKPNTNEKSPK